MKVQVSCIIISTADKDVTFVLMAYIALFFQVLLIIIFIVDTYCICKSGEFGKMIFCDGKDCQIGWWHFKCAKIEEVPVGKWFCRLCNRKF